MCSTRKFLSVLVLKSRINLSDGFRLDVMELLIVEIIRMKRIVNDVPEIQMLSFAIQNVSQEISGI
jgi:hypothetical protein